MKIEDNFLDQEKFDELQTLMWGDNFPWFYNTAIDHPGQKGKFQFTHAFYFNHAPCSQFYSILYPLLEKIFPTSLWRIKANLLTKTPTIVENQFHIDIGGWPEEKLKQWITSIFYVNTNDGYTKFEDGTIVESVANRMITFPANVKHTGTSCTDERGRVVINFNYFTKLWYNGPVTMIDEFDIPVENEIVSA